METCACGGEARGACTRCGRLLCWADVATRITDRQIYTIGLNRAQRSRRNLFLDTKAGKTLDALRQKVNDTWLCGDCLAALEDVALEKLADKTGCPPLPRSGDPLGRLRAFSDPRRFMPYYDKMEWTQAFDAAMRDAGGSVEICKEAARKAWSEWPHLELAGPRKSRFSWQRDVKEVVQVGIRLVSHRSSGQHWTDLSYTTEGAIVVDGEAKWWFAHPGGNPAWTSAPRDRQMAVEVALKVLAGSTKGTLTGVAIYDRWYSPGMDADQRAITAAMSTLSAATEGIVE